MRLKKTTLAWLGLSTTLLTAPALAVDPGDVLIRLGAAGVYPNDRSTDLNNLDIIHAKVGVSNAWSAGLTVSYMATENIGVGVVAAWPFKHDIRGERGISGLGKIGDTKQLPPTLLAEYHFFPKEIMKPYVGIGLNYTWFFDTNAEAPLDSLDLENSWGLAVEAGVDVFLKDDWFINIAGWYMDIDTDAKAKIGSTTTKSHVNIDPAVVMFAIGKRF